MSEVGEQISKAIRYVRKGSSDLSFVEIGKFRKNSNRDSGESLFTSGESNDQCAEYGNNYHTNDCHCEIKGVDTPDRDGYEECDPEY